MATSLNATKNAGNQHATIRASNASDLFRKIRGKAGALKAEEPAECCSQSTGPGDTCAALTRLVGDLREFCAGPAITRRFCAANSGGETAVLAVKNPGWPGMVRVSLESWNAGLSGCLEQFACYVQTAGHTAGRVEDTIKGDPADRALLRALGRALGSNYISMFSRNA